MTNAYTTLLSNYGSAGFYFCDNGQEYPLKSFQKEKMNSENYNRFFKNESSRGKNQHADGI
ncbi:hypothetical protein NCCP2331_18550 [Sporosarcina sp. NCCP-2331]|nr:hypothetical protein NCCP2331_18550 [Sporosarcina sp. NCCP-2331]